MGCRVELELKTALLSTSSAQNTACSSVPVALVVFTALPVVTSSHKEIHNTASTTQSLQGPSLFKYRLNNQIYFKAYSSIVYLF